MIDVRNFLFASSTRAYYPDSSTGQLIVWNPETMEIVRTVSLAPVATLAPEGHTPLYTTPVLRADNTIVLVGSYNSSDTPEPANPFFAAFLELDGTALTGTTKTEGCGNGSAAAFPDGSVYFANNSFAAAYNRIGGLNSFEPCLRRLAPGSMIFDPTYDVKLSEVIGTQASAGLVRGPGTSAYFLGFDEEIIPVSEATDLRAISNGPGWRVYLIDDVAAPSATPPRRLETPPFAGFLLNFKIADRTFFALIGDGLASTTVVRVGDDLLSTEPLITAPGILGTALPMRD